MDDEFRQIFAEEAHDLLRDLESALLALEDAPSERSIVDRIFRIAHTLKGNAGMIGFTPMAELAHAFENTLEPVREGHAAAGPSLVSAMLVVRDALTALVVELGGGAPAEPALLEAARRALDEHDASHATHDAPHPDPRAALHAVTPDALPPRTLGAAPAWDPTPHASPDAPIPPPSPVAASPAAATNTPRPAASATPRAPASAGSRAPEGSSIRVALDKLDDLQNLVGELVIAQAFVTRLVTVDATKDALAEAVAQMERHCRDLQERVLGVRMQPVRGLFQRAQRIVRDLAAQQGKDVVLETEGEEIELDKTVLERVGESLVHLMRNAVDHGVERPDARLAAGKPARSTLALRARQRGGQVFLEIVDDGRGLDRRRIREKAVRLGLLRADETPTDDVLDAMIFAPGFSTAEAITEVSGRGVGMDAVKRSVEELRGSLSVASTPGEGTRVTIRLPLTLAIIDGLTVRVGDEVYVLPLTAVNECLALAAGDVRRPAEGVETVEIRCETVRLLRLASVFGVASSDAARASVLVVVDDGQRRLAVAVDEVLGQQQIVVKSLEANYRSVPGLSGATVLGDGRVALIVDPAGLIDAGQARRRGPRAA